MKKRLLVLVVGFFALTVLCWGASMEGFYSSMGGGDGERPDSGVYGKCLGTDSECYAACPECGEKYYANSKGVGVLTRGKCVNTNCNCSFEGPEGEIDPGPGHGD